MSKPKWSGKCRVGVHTPLLGARVRPLRTNICSMKSRARCTSLSRFITPVAESIFGSLSQTHISKSEFKNEILRSALLDFSVTLLCVCGVDSFITEVDFLKESRLLYDGLNRIGCRNGFSFLLTLMTTDYKQVMRDRTTGSEIFGAGTKDVNCRSVQRVRNP